jgi:hypothetical protein
MLDPGYWLLVAGCAGAGVCIEVLHDKWKMGNAESTMNKLPCSVFHVQYSMFDI